MKKAIVTGATGFIGSVLVNTLIKNNIEVISIGRKNINEIDPNRYNLIKESNYVELDMKDINQLPDILEEKSLKTGSSCVFYHFAWGGESKLSDLNIEAQYKNVQWTQDAFLVAEKLNCEKFIHVGTMEENFTKEYLDLDYKTNDKYNRHVIYSLAKISSKQFLKLHATHANIELIFARNSHVMGPYDDKDSFLQVTLEKLLNGEELIFSSGQQMFDVISVTDCAQAYYLIGEKGLPNKDYWIGSGSPKPLREYVKIMATLFPSNKELRFGELPYNDISLKEEDFSIKLLTEDTGFTPSQSYQETVIDLSNWLKNR